jgi:hypothetical protein
MYDWISYLDKDYYMIEISSVKVMIYIVIICNILSNFLSYWEEICTKGVRDIGVMTIISIIIKPIKVFISVFFCLFLVLLQSRLFYVIRSQNLFVIPF